MVRLSVYIRREVKGWGSFDFPETVGVEVNMGANVSSGVGGVCMRSAAGRDVRG